MENNTGRLEAFSDGIFGVAITLLAIEIGIKEYPGANNLNLWHNILERWPEYFTYFNSFATVLLIWMGHHKMLKHLKIANHWVILANGIVLLLVVLFPFPTKTVGTFIGTPAVNTAVAFYAAFTGCIVIAMLLLNITLIKNPKFLVDANKDLPWLKGMLKGQFIAIAIYGLATLIAFYSPSIALGLTFFMWVFWVFATADKE